MQAKRNADIAKRKERELLLSSARDGEGGPRKTQDKFTQGDLMVNASSDVTAALRRTHDLMQSELSRSQFAQETLGSSYIHIACLSVLRKLTRALQNNLLPLSHLYQNPIATSTRYFLLRGHLSALSSVHKSQIRGTLKQRSIFSSGQSHGYSSAGYSTGLSGG